MITPTRITSPKAAFDEMLIPYTYSRGYAENQTEVQPEWVNEAVRRGKDCDIVLVFAGLTDYVESEGCDRPDMRLPQNQLALIDSMVQTGKKVVVILFGGSPVELPFADQVSAVLNMMLPGQSGGRACAKLLYGEADPAGRLAETWPLTYEDVPFGSAFSKTAIEVYKESVFVGYRYYLTAEKAVRYPFGYGLSYTDFVWSDMRVSREENRIRVTCTVCNTGERAGSEVLQLYVKAPRGGLFKPERELRAFAKIYLKPGESREVTLLLKEADLRYFDPEVKDWVLEGGDYELMLCSDCQTVRLQETIRLEGKEVFADPSVCQVYGGARLDQVSDQLFEKMSGQKIPLLPSSKPITLESRFSDLQQTFFGKILFRAVLNMAEKQLKEARKLPEGPERENRIKGALFLKRILESNSLISMSMSAGKSFPYHLAQGFAAMANGRLIRGIRYFCSPVKVSGKIKKGKHK